MCPLHIPITNECQKTKFQKNHIIALYIQGFVGGVAKPCVVIFLHSLEKGTSHMTTSGAGKYICHMVA